MKLLRISLWKHFDDCHLEMKQKYTKSYKISKIIERKDSAVVRALASRQCDPGSVSRNLQVRFLFSKINISKFQFNPESDGHRLVSRLNITRQLHATFVNNVDLLLFSYLLLEKKACCFTMVFTC